MAWQKAYPHSFRYWQTWLSLALCGFCAVIGGRVGRSIGVGDMAGGMIGGGIGGLIISQTVIHMVRPHLREIAETMRQMPPS